jgi:dipeptidyl-peptidase-4
MEDDNVLFQNSMQMADALEKAGREFAMVVYPQKSHGVEGAVRRQLMQTQVDFLERELK